MASEGAERRLAAILSADAVGYTRLMAEDEAATVRTVTVYRHEISGLVGDHRGRVVDAPGDNLLAEFPTALDAVECAVEIQRVLEARNAGLPEQRRMEFRIGVHMGDVMADGERIYGDGVNIAARLEGLAEPGGICISSEIHGQVESKLDLRFEDLGEQSVKNIPKPVRVFSVRIEAETAPSETRPRSLRLVAVALGVVVLLAVVALAGWRMFADRSQEPSAAEISAPIRSIAVLPLENLSGDPEQEYFADGMTEALISELGKVRSLRVISRTSAMQYKGVRKPVGEIARELNVHAVIEGSVLHAGDRVRITAQLIDARVDQHLWAESYNRDLSDVLALQGEVARTVAREIRANLTPQDEVRLSSSRAVDPETYGAYLKGRYYWNQRTKDGVQKAIAHFKRAIDLDPSYAPAYSGLADAYAIRSYYGWSRPREDMPKAEAAATRALEIDESLAEAHTTLALVRHFYDWKWAEAERHYRRAIELNSSYATAHHWLASVLAVTGRFDEGLAEIRRAQQLDPVSSIIHADLVLYTYLARDYGGAIEVSLTALEIDPRFAMSRVYLALAYLQQSMPQQAISEAEEASRLLGPDPRAMWTVGYVYAVTGRRDDAARIREELISRSAIEYVSPLGMAMIHHGLGDTERALSSLEEAYEERTGELVGVGSDPMWDPLRSDPRFQDLLRRMGFPED